MPFSWEEKGGGEIKEEKRGAVLQSAGVCSEGWHLFNVQSGWLKATGFRYI